MTTYYAVSGCLASGPTEKVQWGLLFYLLSNSISSITPLAASSLKAGSASLISAAIA